MITKKETDWKPILITIGMSVLSGVITGIIFVMTMKGDIRVVAKDVETSNKAIVLRFEGIDKQLGELRVLHLSNKMAILENKQNVHSNLDRLEKNTKKLETVVASVLPEVSSANTEVKKKIIPTPIPPK
jgi:uncharacterized membrane protein YraQ (UPF0718 family)